MTIGTTLVIVFFALLWGWLIYEMHIAPELDDDGNIKIDITEEDLDIRDKNNRECCSDTHFRMDRRAYKQDRQETDMG